MPPLGQRLALLAGLADLLVGHVAEDDAGRAGKTNAKTRRGSRGRWSRCPAGARRSRSRTAAGRRQAAGRAGRHPTGRLARLPRLARLARLRPLALLGPLALAVRGWLLARRRAAGRVCHGRRGGAGRVRVLRGVARRLACDCCPLNGDRIAADRMWLRLPGAWSVTRSSAVRDRRADRVSRPIAPSRRALRATSAQSASRCRPVDRHGLSAGARENLFTAVHGLPGLARAVRRPILTAPPVTREFATR